MAAALLLLSACGGEYTASDATDAANAHLLATLPQMQPAMNRLQIETQDIGGEWRVTYTMGPGTLGLMQIDVSKQTGEARITRFEQ